MVPDPRSWVRGPVRVLRANRPLALALDAVVAAAGVALVATFVVGPDYLPALFGGAVGLATYYQAHYPSVLTEDVGRWNWDGTVIAGFLWLYAIPEGTGTAANAASLVAFYALAFALIAMAELDARETADCPEPDSVVGTREADGRLTGVLRSSELAALGLTFAASVGGFLAAGWLLEASALDAWLLLLGSAPSVYYRVHYPRPSVASPFERRALRVAVAVAPAAWLGVAAGSARSFVVPALLGLLLVDAVTVAERVPALAADGSDEDDAGANATPPWRRAAWRDR